MNTSTMIRPAWTPATVALTVAGFMVFWPLGLAMLAYVIFGDRFEGFKRDANATVDGMCRSWGPSWSASGRSHWGRNHRGFTATGNVAFDEWREKEIDRLNEERRKLDETRAEFEEELRELRRAKDQEEFDRFMARRNASRAAGLSKSDKPASDLNEG